MKPKEIRRGPTGLDMILTDGTLRTFVYGELRKSCACAVCRELKVPLNESMPFFPRATSVVNLELVGNYAIAVTWGDGHRSIYAFDRLFSSQASAPASDRVQEQSL
jgi:DUF971 family protein